MTHSITRGPWPAANPNLLFIREITRDAIGINYLADLFDVIELITLRPDSTAPRGRVSDAGGPRKFDHATRAVQLDFAVHQYCVGGPRTTGPSKGVDITP
ncbi:hypothetical protein ACIBJF_49010 [Streptomyces sp. NPDC050743]|uniref:hypothetical protein n=1 Tax=Streptomyces sp. NPDC050743 TaxID=3365634 RepID=UPI00379286E9